MATAALRSTGVGSLGRVALSVLVLLGAIAASLIVAISNSTWFDAVNSFVGATDGLTRGLLYSSWLVVLGAPVVLARPGRFGFRTGDIRSQVGLIAIVVIGSAAATVALVRLTGATPYSDASLFIEVVVVPFTEELGFRAVLLTALLAVLGRLWDAPTAVTLAIVFNGLAFGAAHLANLATNPAAFTIAQALFAATLGSLCAFLMVRTRSVYPAMLLHAAVNAAVVLGS